MEHVTHNISRKDANRIIEARVREIARDRLAPARHRRRRYGRQRRLRAARRRRKHVPHRHRHGEGAGPPLPSAHRRGSSRGVRGRIPTSSCRSRRRRTENSSLSPAASSSRTRQGKVIGACGVSGSAARARRSVLRLRRAAGWIRFRQCGLSVNPQRSCPLRRLRRQSRAVTPPGAARACPSSAKPRSRRQVNTRPAAHERRARRTAAQVGAPARPCRRRALPSLGKHRASVKRAVEVIGRARFVPQSSERALSCAGSRVLTARREAGFPRQ